MGATAVTDVFLSLIPREVLNEPSLKQTPSKPPLLPLSCVLRVYHHKSNSLWIFVPLLLYGYYLRP
jgi:hypothetical protein